MKIQIFGPGCMNCQTLEQRTRRAAAELGIVAEFEKVTDYLQIAESGILRTPGLAIDGQIVSQGRVNTVAEIKTMLQQFSAAAR
ncbi:MAG: MTH895/ArsE family thioredoxin-like protein [candidate division KSB1 bacterium]|nr:MTH895/ArsE family thioredoxin-like protein [candidate division KSB1 bacterium]MDZ7365316.1 MTH895/ArsE family thioredoxin-like protein [candidate division KSB1 bacterium]MDZ7403183.1 MTH895/ArsE family thioredoxin-like protein [candidate division KSB1 bacterium]